MIQDNKSHLKKTDNGKLSICDVLKNDTSEIIKKLESQTPSFFQNYSNLYTAYLHMWDDLFSTCYISEKEFFDKFNIDQAILKQIKSNSGAIKKMYLENIERNTKFIDEYTKMRISAIRSFDNFAHMMIDSYAKYLTQFNKSKN